MIRIFATCVLCALLCRPGLVMAAENQDQKLRSLIVKGLENNLGLKIDQLDFAANAEDLRLEEAQFDTLFFAQTLAERVKPPFESVFGGFSESLSEEYTGEIGLSRRFRSGLTSTMTLGSLWQSDNDSSDNLDPRYRTALTFNLTQPLLKDFGEDTNTTNLRIAANRVAQADLSQQLEAQLLALQIELLSCRLAGETQIVLLQQQAVALAEELYNANQRRFKTGVIPISEVQQAETELANRQLKLSEADQAKQLDFSELNRLLGYALPQDFSAVGLYPLTETASFPQLAEEEPLFNAARHKNLTLRLASIAIDNSRIEQSFFQNQLKPRLNLNIQTGLNGLSGDERDPSTTGLYAGDWADSLSGALAADGYQWAVGMEFSFPLGNRAATARLNRAKLQHKKARYQQRDQEDDLRRALQQQRINLIKAFEQVGIAERFEQLAETSLDQEQRRLDEGLSDTFRIISFQTGMLNAKVGRINAMVQYFSSLAQLNFTRGIILERHDIDLNRVTEENSLETL
ncbi:MAG: TolC family protein [Desulfuromonadales bacterium]|nr:TolC family protein [Desulfuromonadales bacterium]MBN2793739.1 TolC family protein [Desulfuromonadales bacterium]